VGGKVVLVTGGSSGIGLAAAHRFAEAGATILICGRDQDKLDEACREARAKGYEFLADPADLSDMADVDRFVQQLLADHGGVDVLIWTRCAASEYQAGDSFLTAEPVSRRFMGG